MFRLVKKTNTKVSPPDVKYVIQYRLDSTQPWKKQIAFDLLTDAQAKFTKLKKELADDEDLIAE